MDELLTIGGIPASNALHWDCCTKQKLGQAIYQMYSSCPESRRKGYSAFYELSRFFMKNEWTAFIKQLDDYRIEHGFQPITEMVDTIQHNLANTGSVAPIPETEPGPVDIANSFCPQRNEPVYPRSSPEDPEAVQLSLF